MMILAGDIGGTNSRLALFDAQLNKLGEKDYLNNGHASLQVVIGQFLAENHARPTRASFGIAGPVSGGRVEMTNLGWKIDEASLSSEFRIEKVRLINDMVAHAEGIEVLAADQKTELKPGVSQPGNRCIIAAGTGLGEAGLCFTGQTWIPMASEGGHVDFSPRDPQQDELLCWMRKRVNGPVCWESLVSGPGIRTLYEFLSETRPELPGRLPAGQDGSKQITSAAKSSALAAATVELFAKLYLSEAGNLAAKTIALGGVYIGGGIAIQIQDWLKRPDLQQSFWHKSIPDIAAKLKQISIHLITSDKNGLHGAANAARKL